MILLKLLKILVLLIQIYPHQTDIDNIRSLNNETPAESNNTGVGAELPSENENIVKNQQEAPTVE